MVYGRDWYVDPGNPLLKVGLRTYDPYEYMIDEWTPTQLHNFSINGMSGKTTFNIGLGYLDQTGIIKPAKDDSFQRYNGSLQFTTEVNDWLKVNFGTVYSKRNKNYAYATNSTTADPWLYIYRWASTYPMTTEDGKPIRSPAFEMAPANTAFQETNFNSLNGGFTITPTKDWTIKFDYTHQNEEYTNKKPGTRFTAGDSWSAAVAKFDAEGNRIYVNRDGEEVASTDDGAMPAYKLNQTTYTGSGANPDHLQCLRGTVSETRLTCLRHMISASIHPDDFKFMVGMNRVSYKTAYSWSQIASLADYSKPTVRSGRWNTNRWR